MQRVKSIDGITIFFPSLPKNPRHRALVFTISSRYIFSRRETNRDATLSYLERISEIHTEELLLLSLLSLSLITLFLSLARTLLENFPRTESRGAIFSRGGLERKGKERGDYSFTGRWIDLTWMKHTHSLSFSLSLSLRWKGKKGQKKTFLVAGLSARVCLRGGASGSLYKRSWPGGGRVCLPFKRGR